MRSPSPSPSPSPLATPPKLIEYSVPTAGAGLYTIVAGPDRNVWFTESEANKIGRITPSGLVSEFPIPSAETGPWGITMGSDHNIWFTETDANKIGRITMAGKITEFPIPTAHSIPGAITAGQDGSLWFSERGVNAIGRITVTGSITEFPLTSCSECGTLFPGGIASGNDGNIWASIENSSSTNGQIVRISPTGAISTFLGVTPGCCFPDDISTGPDGNLWYTEVGLGQVGVISTSGSSRQVPLSTGGTTGYSSGITSGVDGNIWLAGHENTFVCPEPHRCYYYPSAAVVFRVTPSGVVTPFGLPDAASDPQYVTSGPPASGTMWVTEWNANKIGKFRP